MRDADTMRDERSMAARREPATVCFGFDEPLPSDIDDAREFLGGKGASLREMTAMGLPVPPGFTIATAACRGYLRSGWSTAVEEDIRTHLRRLEDATDKRLGDPASPLLLSVRSGAVTSMPGIMDTVLNVGMTPEVANGLAVLTGDLAFAHDTHVRAVLNFAELVCGAPPEVIERAAHDGLATHGGASTHIDLMNDLGFAVPADPFEQVMAAVRAIFDSWSSERAVFYRDFEGIPDHLGTAATVQSMVFGNLGEDSGTGVAFTRDPATGARRVTGDFLVKAQGEDVVAGTHRTLPLSEMEERWPRAWEELERIGDLLERRWADVVDIEFTVERGKLWLLQARKAKLSPLATLRVAVDMAQDEEFPADRTEAVRRCRHLLDDPPRLTDSADAAFDDPSVVIVEGIAASPGCASGVLCLDLDDALRLHREGNSVVLVRRETSPSDIPGIAASTALVTTLGGLVSHAAVVARSWGRPAIVGATGLELGTDHVVGTCGRVAAGSIVTVDGDRGRFLLGSHDAPGALPDDVRTLRRWVQELEQVGHSTTPVQAATDDATGEATEFAVLHALRIKGMASVTALAATAGSTPTAVKPALERFVERGWVHFVDARDCWQLLPQGAEAHGELVGERAASLPLEQLPYDEFRELNSRFKEVCAQWQLRNGAPNDHSDPSYDAAVIDALGAIADEAAPLVASLAATIPWIRKYGPRLNDAMVRVRSGDRQAFTGVMCDSFHDIWMELHEDLILVQGIERAAEGST